MRVSLLDMIKSAEAPSLGDDLESETTPDTIDPYASICELGRSAMSPQTLERAATELFVSDGSNCEECPDSKPDPDPHNDCPYFDGSNTKAPQCTKANNAQKQINRWLRSGGIGFPD